MSLGRDLALLRGLAAIDTTPSFGYSPDRMRSIHLRALTETANWVNESIIQPLMDRPGPPAARASGAGEPPKYRTGSLRDSLAVLPAAANAAKPTVFLMVHPNAVDRTKGRRLQLYSRYLETGWTPGPSRRRLGAHRILPSGESGDTFERPFAGTTAPRPYIRQIFIRNEFDRIQSKYRWEIRRMLPGHMKRQAGLFKLELTYVPPFSFNEPWGVM